ncbi:hypothetical protein [Streptomyces kaniharaensis]|nr:hypothetical protein [Streptomyces kaniharaensis]
MVERRADRVQEPDAVVATMREVAEVLAAKVQGEDGDYYDA